MLLNLLYFAIISFFCILWGLPILTTQDKTGKKDTIDTTRILSSFFIGLVALSVVASWIALFAPVRVSVLILLSAIWTISTKKYWIPIFSIKKQLTLPKVSLAEGMFVCSCILLFSYMATKKPTMEDSDLYHLQNIKWAHEFGVVPGLANLYLRFGFYSNWFHAISLFDIPTLNKNFLYLNFTFVVWFFLFLFNEYKINIAQSNLPQQHLSIFIVLCLFFMLFEWDLFRVATSSTTYDFVVSAMVLLCFILFLKKIVHSSNEEDDFVLLVLIIATPFFKMTGFFLTVFWLLLFYSSKNKLQLLARSATIYLICFIPYATKNYMQTGYIFFPYKIFSFWHPDWQVPSGMLYLFNKYIYQSNHYINQPIPGFSTTNGSSFSFFRDWFLHLVTSDKLIIAGAFLLFPLLSVFVLRLYKRQFRKVFVLYGFSLFVIFAWLAASPDPRFAYGFLMFLTFFPLSAVIVKYVKGWMISSSLYLFTAVIFIYLYFGSNKEFTYKNILRPSTATVPSFKIIQINNQKYNLPSIINNNWNIRCINTPLPCLYEFNPYLQPRGTNIKNGFQMRPYPDSSFILNYNY
jgi:hypothetical protein